MRLKQLSLSDQNKPCFKPSTCIKSKFKQTKKGRKSKEKTEEISSSPAPRKSTKSAKSKKGIVEFTFN